MIVLDMWESHFTEGTSTARCHMQQRLYTVHTSYATLVQIETRATISLHSLWPGNTQYLYIFENTHNYPMITATCISKEYIRDLLCCLDMHIYILCCYTSVSTLPCTHCHFCVNALPSSSRHIVNYASHVKNARDALHQIRHTVHV